MEYTEMDPDSDNMLINIALYLLIAAILALSLIKLYMVYFSDEAINRRVAKRRRRRMHKRKRRRHHQHSSGSSNQ